MFTQWALRPDSAGAGTHRGGVGAIYEIESLTDADVPPGRARQVRAVRRGGRHAGGPEPFLLADG